jgi:hypothetical protein
MPHIAIGTTVTIVTYTATASQTDFSIPFEFFDEADLDVYQAGTLKTLTTHYTITPTTTYTGGYQGGTMVLGTGATVSDVIVIELNMTPQRAVDFPVSGAFNIDTLNTWIDKIMVFFKQAFENIDRKVGRSSTDTSSYSLDLPTGVTSTAKALVVDTSSGFTLGPTTADISGAAASATAAATSATASASSATAASSSQTAAATSATAAAASAALIAAGTASTTSLAIGTGSKAFTITAGLGFNVGDYVLATSNADITNYMHGQIASYSSTTLTVTVTSIGGSGTKTDWTIRLSGVAGATGATGSTGSTGPIGPVGIGLSLALGG